MSPLLLSLGPHTQRPPTAGELRRPSGRSWAPGQTRPVPDGSDNPGASRSFSLEVLEPGSGPSVLLLSEHGLQVLLPPKRRRQGRWASRWQRWGLGTSADSQFTVGAGPSAHRTRAEAQTPSPGRLSSGSRGACCVGAPGSAPCLLVGVRDPRDGESACIWATPKPPPAQTGPPGHRAPSGCFPGARNEAPPVTPTSPTWGRARRLRAGPCSGQYGVDGHRSRFAVLASAVIATSSRSGTHWGPVRVRGP